MAAFLLEEHRQHQEQRRRTMWVPWLLRRVTLGHYDTLMQELMRESRSFSDTLYSALSAYFDIMMLTSHYLPTVGLLFKFF